MNWSWFDLAFPWIGAIGAIVLLALLFGTNLLQGEPNSFRWRDLVWLSWMGTVAYLLHNVEECGLDLFGNQHSFPNELCANLKLPAYPDCPITPAFFLAVNIPLFWIAAPLAAFVGRRHPLVGLAIYSVIFINGLGSKPNQAIEARLQIRFKLCKELDDGERVLVERCAVGGD